MHKTFWIRSISLEGILIAFNLSTKLHQRDWKEDVLTPHKKFHTVVLLYFLSQVLFFKLLISNFVKRTCQAKAFFDCLCEIKNHFNIMLRYGPKRRCESHRSAHRWRHKGRYLSLGHFFPMGRLAMFTLEFQLVWKLSDQFS